MECSLFEEWENEWDYENPTNNFPRCPICKGFLSPYFPQDKPFTCKKCGAELMVFEYIEDGEKIPWLGKICPINHKTLHQTKKEEEE